MSTFLLIYRVDPAALAAMAEPTPEQSAQMMNAWNAWALRAGGAIIDFGNPTTPASEGADAGVGGYSLLRGDDFAQITALLEGHPHVAMGGTIDVYETHPVPAA